jgi:TolA-binding protein
MKRAIVRGAAFGLLGLALVLGPTGSARSGPAMDDERMTQMMKMMGEMQEQMKSMRQQMQGMGPMHGRMEQMMGEMGRMRTMMEQHRGQMMKQCPGAGAPAAPSK